MSTTKPSVLRALAQEAAQHPRIEAAVIGAIRVELPTVIEGILQQMYAGQTVRLYVRKRADSGSSTTAVRDQRILAAKGLHSAALVAAREGISERQVRRVWARG